MRLKEYINKYFSYNKNIYFSYNKKYIFFFHDPNISVLVYYTNLNIFFWFGNTILDGLANERTCLRGPIIGLRGGCTKYSCVEACVEQFGSSENGICMANGACCCKI